MDILAILMAKWLYLVVNIRDAVGVVPVNRFCRGLRLAGVNSQKNEACTDRHYLLFEMFKQDFFHGFIIRQLLYYLNVNQFIFPPDGFLNFSLPEEKFFFQAQGIAANRNAAMLLLRENIAAGTCLG
jgi:hypothetical protein